MNIQQRTSKTVHIQNKLYDDEDSPNEGKNINKNRVKTVTKSCMRLMLSKICISKKMNLTLKLMFNSDKSKFL